jgi:hypothetical protein
MAHPLESARLKLDRARQHFEQLEAEVNFFLRGHPYIGLPYYDTQSGKHEIRARKFAEPDPALGLIAGDLVHNLRSALDHIVYALAALGDQKRGERTAFPIYDNEKAYLRHRSELLRGVPDEQARVIDQLQPFRTGDDAIMKVARLDDRDKHRVITPLIGSAVAGRLKANVGKVYNVAFPKPPIYFDDNAILCRFETDPRTDVGVEYEIVGVEVAFTAETGDPVTLGAIRTTMINAHTILRVMAPAFDPPAAGETPPGGSVRLLRPKSPPSPN